MSQLNIHMTPMLEQDLREFMRLRHIKNKSEAIRIALREGVEHSIAHTQPTDFPSWLGLGKQMSLNKKLKFHSDNDFWE